MIKKENRGRTPDVHNKGKFTKQTYNHGTRLKDEFETKGEKFEKNFDDLQIICTGSYNLTKKAKEKNEENMEFRSSRLAVKKYGVQFETIKRRSKKLELKSKLKVVGKKELAIN